MRLLSFNPILFTSDNMCNKAFGGFTFSLLVLESLNKEI